MTSRPIYYCSNCKKLIDELDSLLFVEDHSTKGFCSNECIEQFYHFLGNHFARLDREYRAALDVKNEKALDYVGVPRLMEKTLKRPQEIWMLENQIGEKVFSFIYHEEAEADQTLYSIILCLVYQDRPSYILFSTATFNEALLMNYRMGHRVEDLKRYYGDQEEKAIELDQEMLEYFEQKKSSILAQMMVHRKETDISFETFPMYLDCHGNTLENPDEVYKSRDEEGDEIYIYLKAHDRQGISFYYIVICVPGQNRMDGKKSLFPILSFPTLDPKLHAFYQQGDKILGGLSN